MASLRASWRVGGRGGYKVMWGLLYYNEQRGGYVAKKQSMGTRYHLRAIGSYLHLSVLHYRCCPNYVCTRARRGASWWTAGRFKRRVTTTQEHPCWGKLKQRESRIVPCFSWLRKEARRQVLEMLTGASTTGDHLFGVVQIEWRVLRLVGYLHTVDYL